MKKSLVAFVVFAVSTCGHSAIVSTHLAGVLTYTTPDPFLNPSIVAGATTFDATAFVDTDSLIQTDFFQELNGANVYKRWQYAGLGQTSSITGPLSFIGTLYLFQVEALHMDYEPLDHYKLSVTYSSFYSPLSFPDSLISASVPLTTNGTDYTDLQDQGETIYLGQNITFSHRLSIAGESLLTSDWVQSDFWNLIQGKSPSEGIFISYFGNFGSDEPFFGNMSGFVWDASPGIVESDVTGNRSVPDAASAFGLLVTGLLSLAAFSRTRRT